MTLRSKAMFGLALAAIVASATALAYAQEHGGGHAAPSHDSHGSHEPRAAADHDGHGAAAHGEGYHALPSINWTDVFDKKQPAVIALVINFGLLAGLYYTVGKKPVAVALKLRRQTIAKDIDDARKRLDEAEERAKKYQADLKNVDADTETAKNALITAGKGEVVRLLADAKEKAGRMKRDAERLVDQERKQIHQDLHREAVERAVREAMKILERSVTPEDHTRFAEDLLAELARRPAAGSVRPPTARGAS